MRNTLTPYITWYTCVHLTMFCLIHLQCFERRVLPSAQYTHSAFVCFLFLCGSTSTKQTSPPPPPIYQHSVSGISLLCDTTWIIGGCSLALLCFYYHGIKTSSAWGLFKKHVSEGCHWCFASANNLQTINNSQNSWLIQHINMNILVLSWMTESTKLFFGASHFGGRIKLTPWHACPKSRPWQV